jgi:hypothetical protein
MPEFTSKLGNRVTWDVEGFVPMLEISMPDVPGREQPTYAERREGHLLVRWSRKTFVKVSLPVEVEHEIAAAFVAARAARKAEWEETCREMDEANRLREIRHEEARSAGDHLDEWLANRGM